VNYTDADEDAEKLMSFLDEVSAGSFRRDYPTCQGNDVEFVLC
jgi:hypothetical protein